MSPSATNGEHGQVRSLPLSYDNQDSKASALKLIFTLMPQWAGADGQGDGHVELIRFTDGITNTLLQAVNRAPGRSKSDIERESILLRAYGNGTAILIDREREAANHELLMKHGLAPDLLARFKNGMLYRYVSGTVARSDDLCKPDVLKAIARRLAEWHVTVPCVFDSSVAPNATDECDDHGDSNESRNGDRPTKLASPNVVPGKPTPTVWTTIQKWLLALPTETDVQRQRQASLQRELDEIVALLSQRPGFGRDGLVFAHCDLLCANIIMHHEADRETTVSFIDYEYGTPSPAAFDLANHFAEWAGYDCDYSAVPTRGQREAFVREYIRAYARLTDGVIADEDDEVRKLVHEVDVFRGLPGFYWGIWALIQAMISEIDFDYASYAESRLGEYWAYKAEEDGSRAAAGKEIPLREETWARTD